MLSAASKNRLSAQKAKHQKNEKYDEEDEKQYARNPSGRRRYAGEPEHARDNRNDEKNECPSKHLRSPYLRPAAGADPIGSKLLDRSCGSVGRDS
jgi:hypothetical protein